MFHTATMRRRLPLLLASSLAGLSLAAAPALAGSDGDEPPPVVQPPAPAPPAPLPLPPAATPVPAPEAPKSGVKDESNTRPAKHEKPAARSTSSRRTAPQFVQTTVTRGTTAATFPRGGVQAGGGGTAIAPSTPTEALGLGGASLLLVLAAGGLTAVRRRDGASR
jgi:hypothetical protein